MHPHAETTSECGNVRSYISRNILWVNDKALETKTQNVEGPSAQNQKRLDRLREKYVFGKSFFFAETQFCQQAQRPCRNGGVE